MKNSSGKFAILTLVIVAICVGFIIYFATRFPVRTVNVITTDDNTVFEASIKDVEEVKVTEFNAEKAKEVADEYIKALNDEDWATVEKYSKGMASTLRNYKLSDVTIVKNSKNEDFEYSEEQNEYVFLIEYSFETTDENDIKALGNGKYFIVKVVDGIVKVNPFATSL